MRDNGGFLNKAALWYPVSMDSFLHLYVTLPARSNPKGSKCLCVGKAKCKFKGSVQLSRVRLFATPWIAAHQASLSIPNSRSSLKLMSIKSVMPSSHLILCRPLFLLPPIPPIIRVSSNESTLHLKWPKYWSFSFSIIPSKEHSGLISFRMDWLDLLAIQGTLKSLPNTTVQKHQFSGAQLSSQSNSYITVQLSQSNSSQSNSHQ